MINSIHRENRAAYLFEAAKKASHGKESNLVGVHLDIEEPQHPDLVIENNENLEEKIN